jgi:hypothetical protein
MRLKLVLRDLVISGQFGYLPLELKYLAMPSLRRCAPALRVEAKLQEVSP